MKTEEPDFTNELTEKFVNILDNTYKRSNIEQVVSIITQLDTKEIIK